MSIAIGQHLPDAEVRLVDDGIRTARTGDLFARGKTLLFGVPGAFTPTCSEKHLPGYVDAFDAFRQRGIAVYCLAVNDAYVMQAWAASRRVPPGLGMLADGNGDFTRALGLELDRRAYGMGLRTRRSALYAEDGVVKLLQVEAPGELRVSTAEAMLDVIVARG
ncbi:MAG: peroxiredoxin [Rhodanobacter sp.]|nr:MAG: peroxiredoxin [Rhodanobacter sp.]TAM08670.1 MAG: peroxiredoxin [Rhodanobacter sp.]TAM36166.1 MAG: peroxiredoxin [Rhodanobacter sp.]